MPDLGTYAFAVLSSYGVTIVLLVVIVLVSVWRARKVKSVLDEIENRRGR
ncbi:MAG: heme exporter protein CcmD [Pelagibaca sp.]